MIGTGLVFALDHDAQPAHERRAMTLGLLAILL
jgi:hypothetical protein